MSKAPNTQQLNALDQQLDVDGPIPRQDDAEMRLVSFSRTFRERAKALQFAQNIELGIGETLIGGCTKDSIGQLWWLGVRLDSVERWRAKGGFHRVAMRDPEIPESEML